MRNLLLFTVFLALPFSAWAEGDRSGNGGSGILCKKGKASVVYVRDYMEAREQALTISLPGRTHMAKVANVIGRLKTRDPIFFQALSEVFNRFEQESSFTSLMAIRTVADWQKRTVSDSANNSIFQIKDKDCVDVQIAAQVKNPKPGQSRYFIDKDLWALMDENQRAILVLHEILYQIEIPTFDRLINANSNGVRYFVGLIASSYFDELDPTEYDRAARSLRNLYASTMLNGYRVAINSFSEFSKESALTREIIPLVLTIKDFSYPVKCTGVLRFDMLGNLVECSLAEPLQIKVNSFDAFWIGDSKEANQNRIIFNNQKMMTDFQVNMERYGSRTDLSQNGINFGYWWLRVTP